MCIRMWSNPHHQHQAPKGVGHEPPGALRDHLQSCMGHWKIRCNPQMQKILLDLTQHPQHQHQGPKSVGNVPPGALKDHLKGQMGYQKICCNPHMHSISLDGTQHPHKARAKTGFSSSFEYVLTSFAQNMIEFSTSNSRDVSQE